MRKTDKSRRVSQAVTREAFECMREAIEYKDEPRALRSLFEQLRSTGADMDALHADASIRAAMAADMDGDMDRLARDLHESRIANEMDVESPAVRGMHAECA